MKKTSAIFIFLLTLTLAGCNECRYDYTYTIDNQSSYDITVTWSREGKSASFDIAQNESREILSTQHGIETCDGPHEGNVSRDFQSIKITAADTLVSTKIYKSDDSWLFEEGNYTSVVRDDEFN